MQIDTAARPVVLEQEVQHAGDGVRAILGRRAVAQHLDLSQRDRRDGRNVRALRPVGDTIADPRDDRAPMPALSVDQHQRMVGREAAQGRGANEPACVTDWLRVDVVGGHEGSQLIANVGVALPDDVFGRNDVDRHRRVGD